MTGDLKTNWFYFMPKKDYVFKEGDVEGMDDRNFGGFRKNVISASVLQVLRLVFFLVSPSCVTETVVRQKPAKKAPAVVRSRYKQARVVSVSKDRTNYEYEEHDPSGRHVTVRFRVVGHFKHFTKGRLAGRVLWCPPHWRGPDVGVQVEKKYVVEGVPS
jgi:hypothetical protein